MRLHQRKLLASTPLADRLSSVLSKDAQAYVRTSLLPVPSSVLDKLLQPDPAHRRTLKDVLESVMRSKTTRELQQAVGEARRMELEQLQTHLDKRLDHVDSTLATLSASLDSLFRTVLTVGVDVMPRVFLLVPGGPPSAAAGSATKQGFFKRMAAKAKRAVGALDPRKFLQNEFQLHLVCEMSSLASAAGASGTAAVPCCATQPVTVRDLKAFVKKALPVIQVGLKLAKLACNAGRFAGLPLPALGDLGADFTPPDVLQGAVETTLEALLDPGVLALLGLEVEEKDTALEQAEELSAALEGLDTGVSDAWVFLGVVLPDAGLPC